MTKKKDNRTVLDTAFNNVKFIPEWTRGQFETMEKAIVRYFTRIPLMMFNDKPVLMPKSWEGLDELLGFAYTSSSSCAMYSVCNGELQAGDGYSYVYFAIGEDGNYYAELWDEDERKRVIRL